MKIPSISDLCQRALCVTGRPVAWHKNGPKGAWIPAERLISIRYGMSDAQTRTTLAHEIAHAERGDPPCEPNAPNERRADRRAAELLIRPHRYEAAERAYGEHPALLARELTVTQTLITTYQRT